MKAAEFIITAATILISFTLAILFFPDKKELTVVEEENKKNAEITGDPLFYGGDWSYSEKPFGSMKALLADDINKYGVSISYLYEEEEAKKKPYCIIGNYDNVTFIYAPYENDECQINKKLCETISDPAFISYGSLDYKKICEEVNAHE